MFFRFYHSSSLGPLTQVEFQLVVSILSPKPRPLVPSAPSFSPVVVCNPQGVTSCFSGNPGTAKPHWLGDPLLRFDPCHMTSSPGCSCQSLTLLDFHRKCLTVITWTSARVQSEKTEQRLQTNQSGCCCLCCHVQFFCLFGLATARWSSSTIAYCPQNDVFLLVWAGHCRFRLLLLC